MERTLIIAEAGVNHNGSVELALQLVDVAADAGANAVKFQTFKADALASPSAKKAGYQKKHTDAVESQRDMLRKLELDEDAHWSLVERCRQRDIKFMSTPFDSKSADFLLNGLDLPVIKVSSGDLTNAPLLLQLAWSHKKIILSTGMATLGEIEQALGVLAFGYLHVKGNPSGELFATAYRSGEGQAALQAKISLLHCTTEYPAPAKDVNLMAMDTLRSAFRLPVGYSDHTEGIAVPIAAVARGAVIIEKHFTLNRDLPGPDHQASLEPTELAEMVRSIRVVENSLGDGVKIPSPAEMGNRAVARKSLVALQPICAGETFSESNLGIQRPGAGVSPLEYWKWLGKVSKRDYGAGEVIEE